MTQDIHRVVDPAILADSTPENSDGDSIYTIESDLTSISSSILNYEYKNGRRYHAYQAGSYVLPNDEEEQDRMDLLHHIYNLVLDGQLHSAPIGENPQRVLDLGTGTGIWAVDFADHYASSDVTGNDLSAIQPKWTPPNCQFEVDDFEAEWTYSRPFDYIHGRELAGAVSNFGRLTKQAYANLKPGGHFEVQSFRIEVFSDDGTLDKAPYTKQLVSLLQEASAKFGKSMAEMDSWPEELAKAGFKDVNCRIVKVPFNPWPKDPKQKEIGRFFQVQQAQGIQSYAPELLTKVLGWSSDEVSVLVAHAKKELRDTSIHQYGKLYLVYGQKP
ncbi:class I SAM-dependent methyltransferase [Aspergillus candidus]|uniref:UMTA methyltransferase family protein n=1 Tax=Aspergillus candidus TaxID=41067 RepID=A0A2I2F773_ASPCN|nr:UMTA methyltransferase family protein [Aspergillus candidus]PLB36482.1 UMTA methyltransferase family protein [Aspergillus candidus]